MRLLPYCISRIQNFSATPLPWPLSRRLIPDLVTLPSASTLASLAASAHSSSIVAGGAVMPASANMSLL